MSELALRAVVDQVVGDLEQRGFPISAKLKRPIERSGTAGFWCKIHDIDHGHLELWLDRWKNTESEEFYFGYASSKRSEMDRFFQILSDGSPVFEIKEELEEYFENDQVRLKKEAADTLGFGMMAHHHRGAHWFGRYAPKKNIVRDATSFFAVIIQEVSPPSFREGSCTQVTSDRRERDPKARRACLQQHGFMCQICDFDFEETYGSEIGTDFIHVHHTRPLGEGQRETHPEKHLIPVCPNCHAMLHRRNPPISPDELRRMIHQAARTL